MANHKLPIPFIRQVEGKLSKQKADSASKRPVPDGSGYHTNKGITWGTFEDLADLLGYEATPELFYKMPDDIWEKIFKQGYWDKVGGDKIKSQAIAEMMADFAWGSGPKVAIQGIQEVINTSYGKKILAVDGIIGPETIEAINKAVDANEWALCKNYDDFRRWFLEQIIKRNPSQKKFEKGWFNRLDLLLERAEKLIDSGDLIEAPPFHAPVQCSQGMRGTKGMGNPALVASTFMMANAIKEQRREQKQLKAEAAAAEESANQGTGLNNKNFGKNIIKIAVGSLIVVGGGYWLYKYIRKNSVIDASPEAGWATRLRSALESVDDDEEGAYQVAWEIPNNDAWKKVQSIYNQKFGRDITSDLQSNLTAEEIQKFNSYLVNKTGTPPKNVLVAAGQSAESYQYGKELDATLAKNKTRARITKNDIGKSVYPMFYFSPTIDVNAAVRYVKGYQSFDRAFKNFPNTWDTMIYLLRINVFGKITGVGMTDTNGYPLWIKVLITDKFNKDYNKELVVQASNFTISPPPALSGLGQVQPVQKALPQPAGQVQRIHLSKLL